MVSPKWRGLFCLAAVSAVAVVASSLAQAGDGDWVKVFNGKDMTGYKYILAVPKTIEVDGKKKTVNEMVQGDDPLKTPTGTWKVEDGAIICTGKPNGYFYSTKSYKNYLFKYDWRYQRPADLKDEEKFTGNSGFLAGITGEHKVWPKCIEVQGMNQLHGKVYLLGGFKGNFTFDQDTLKKVRKPVGEWNTTEITIDNGKIVAKVNGAVVASGEGDRLEGPWGMQSEGAEIHFRNIYIKELK